jgi:glyoxylase-like metal-dependent hydrolase (beta-lactamase superfamily II)
MADFCRHYPRPAYAELQRIPSAEDGWFEVYTVAEGVTAIYEPHQWQEVISYLIEGTDRALLFDTGNGIGDIRTVVDGLTAKPVTVLNSHGHFDHVGGNHAFDRILGMDTDFTRARQAGQPNAAIALEVSAAALCRPAPGGVSEATHVGRPYTISRFVADGQRIDLGGRTLEIIHLPGHTPDAIALIDREAGLLWTGDSFYAGPIWLYAPETDLVAYRRSLERLVELSKEVRWLLPAHNTPRVSASVLVDVLGVYDRMIAGDAMRVAQGDGMVEYRFPGEDRFSFLMRDEPLPYARRE